MPPTYCGGIGGCSGGRNLPFSVIWGLLPRVTHLWGCANSEYMLELERLARASFARQSRPHHGAVCFLLVGFSRDLVVYASEQIALQPVVSWMADHARAFLALLAGLCAFGPSSCLSPCSCLWWPYPTPMRRHHSFSSFPDMSNLSSSPRTPA